MDSNCVEVEKPREDFVSKKAVPITTTIPFNIHQDIKASKMSWNSLILRGWEATQGFNGLTKRAQATEEEVIMLQKKSETLQNIIFQLNDKIEELEKRGSKK